MKARRKTLLLARAAAEGEERGTACCREVKAMLQAVAH
jgi:hypothetical protein